MKLRNKKTGVIGELSGVNRIVVYEPNMLLCGNSILGEYDTLAELNKDWEDYTPAEPLIKDEKNRKVARAWLEANDLDGATFHTSSHFFHYWNLRGFNDNGQGVDIDFFLTGEGIPNLIDGKYYTKFELCGEEEE